MRASFLNNYHYNPRLKDRARELRQNMTKAEVCLWKFVLSTGKMKAYGFHRQRPVMDFIADFLCEELLLIIEVDGPTHQYDDQIKIDERRSALLEAAGFRVIRFRNEEVLKHIESVRRAIEEVVSEIEGVEGDRSRASWEEKRE